MATSTTPRPEHMDEYGIERANPDDPGMVGKLRQQHAWLDHVMRMKERYGERGGDQYAAGITYFSVLSMFPLLMLVFAAVATVLASRPDLITQIQDKITSSVSGSMADTLNTIIDTAISQRGAIAGIGGVTALWSGLGWMNNLRYGVSKMWMYPVTGGNFLIVKLKDLLALIGLLVVLILAIAVTAIGSSGLTWRLIELVHLDQVPGISYMAFAVSLLVGLLANFVMFFWMLTSLPRGKVPVKSGAQAALIGAVAFEVFKQLGSMFFSNALKNPAGATFGPIIGVMVLFYFVWRIMLYCSAWAATTPESLAVAPSPAPAPAVIRVREEVRPEATRSFVGAGVAAGALAAGLWSVLRRK
ncbi:inner membrane protein YhjD [Corynebacterium vitaeruminis]|uniref:Inner membrane protein YhjD n=1 Tax=Corynebacterium vitaeruminis DSM 20294 TaxID=1224164 RepID=W5XYF4_9CORY|nr:hypothetical protein B843_02830 [Corynebacterium vitaeruminis DSM 20294]